jgi:GrpB-like predicted nucleotidyltransferase (UPF0157 family)
MFHVKQESPYDDELQIEPYFNPPVACHDYDPDAPEVAQRVALMVTHRLPTLTVEHVGSSSVPGCAGKGVIDLMLLYPPGQLEEAKGVLAELGFQRQTSRDPFPEDRPMRTGSVQYQGKRYRLHVHVLAAASQESKEMRAFRDRLRADPGLVAAYVARKREIIESGVSDSLEYVRVKGSFVQGVLSE